MPTDVLRSAVLTLAAATLVACEPARENAPPSAVAAAESSVVAVPRVQSQFHIAQPLHELGDSADRVERLRERALGIVVPTWQAAVPHELTVINDTAYEIRTLARVRFYPRPEGGWTDTLWTREPNLYGSLMRATHDDYGLPVMERHGRWLLVHYAYAADGSPRSGWVQLMPNRSAFHDWDQQLIDFSTSLVKDSTEFFAAPAGARQVVSLAPSYTLRVLRITPDWIQVVIMRPDTSACTGDEDLQVERRDTAWIRRYDAAGKRQLRSAFAGC